MKRAFTLIELLVVISIIALLVAILLPALSAAKDSAKKIQCLANLKQLATAAGAFSADSKGEPLPGGDKKISVGMDAHYYASGSAWQTTTPEKHKRYGFYRRHGVAMNEGYSTAPEILYCPTIADNSWLKPGGEHPSLSHFSGYYGSSERPSGITVMLGSYYYRETYQGKPYTSGGAYDKNDLVNPVNLDRDLPDMVISSDPFAKPTNLDEGHGDGYNFVRVDASGEFYRDSSREIEGLAGGGKYHSSWDHTDAQSLMEQAWETFRYGELVGEDLVKP